MFSYRLLRSLTKTCEHRILPTNEMLDVTKTWTSSKAFQIRPIGCPTTASSHFYLIPSSPVPTLIVGTGEK